jgi:hypothetical protein
VSAETAIKEKDFYYSKLRAIELLCNTGGVAGSPVSRAALQQHLELFDIASAAAAGRHSSLMHAAGDTL